MSIIEDGTAEEFERLLLSKYDIRPSKPWAEMTEAEQQEAIAAAVAFVSDESLGGK